MATEQTQQIEQKITTVPLGDGNNVKDTTREVDQLMDEALPAFLTKKGVDLKTGERTTHETPERKEHAPATAEQKKEIVDELEADGVKKEPKSDKKETPGRGEDGKFVKAEERVEEKKEQKKSKTEPKFDDLSDEGINKEVESLKTGKAETKERYGALLRELKTAREAGEMTKKEYEKARAEVAEARKAAEEAGKKAVEPEDVKKQREAERTELAMLRRQYQLENDPEVKKNFDDRVGAVEESIAKTLTDAGVPAAAVELIKKSGGWIAFSKSKAPMAWNETNADGETVVRKGTQAEYARAILGVIDASDSAAVNARSGEQVLLRDQKARYIEEEKKKATEYFQNIEKQQAANRDAVTGNLKKLEEEYGTWVTKVTSEEAFLKDEEIPAKATADERKAIEEANADRKTIREYIAAQAKTTSLDAYQDLVLNAARGKMAEKITDAAEAEIAEKDKKITELQAELDKVRGAGRSVPKSGSIASGSASTAEPKKKSAESPDDILADLDKFAQEHAS